MPRNYPMIPELSHCLHRSPLPSTTRPLGTAVGNGIVAVGGEGEIILLDHLTFQLEGRITLDTFLGPNGLIQKSFVSDMTIVKGRLFAPQVFTSHLIVVDLAKQRVTHRLPVGDQGRIAVSPDRQKIYFADNVKNALFLVDVDSLNVQRFDFPGGGRGIGSLLPHPDGKRLFLGIQRGGTVQGRSLRGGNAFLAVFDVVKQEYVERQYLAEVIGPEQSDDSIPWCLTLSPDGAVIYVGMFQSQQGILVVNADSCKVLRGIRFSNSSAHQRVFKWVDPLAQAIYGDLLLSINRHNYELSVLTRRDEKVIGSIELGGTQDGPNTLQIIGDRAIICHAEFSELLVVDLLGMNAALRTSASAVKTSVDDPQEIRPEMIREFEKLKDAPIPSADTWANVMREIPEVAVKEAICGLLGDLPRNDWSGEIADHFTSTLHVHGKRLTGGFIFKGPAKFREMTLDMLGARADQIQRLATTEAHVLIVQHAHDISVQVRKELRVWAREGPSIGPRYYCFIDGKDTYRLLQAYEKFSAAIECGAAAKQKRTAGRKKRTAGRKKRKGSP